MDVGYVLYLLSVHGPNLAVFELGVNGQLILGYFVELWVEARTPSIDHCFLEFLLRQELDFPGQQILHNGLPSFGLPLVV